METLSALFGDTARSLDEVMEDLVQVIPRATRYPEAVCVRLVLGNREVRTPGRGETRWIHTQTLGEAQGGLGSLEIGCLEGDLQVLEDLGLEPGLPGLIARQLECFIAGREHNQRLRRYRSIIATISDPFYILDREYRYRLVNEAFCDLYQRPRAQVIGRHAAELVGEDDFTSRYRPCLERCLAGERVDLEDWIEFPAVGRRAMIKSYFPLVDEGGKEVTGIVVTTCDITERKRMEEALLDSRQRLADIIDFLPDAAFVIDSQRRVIAWNRAIERMTGVAKDEILGKGEGDYAVPFYGGRRPLLIDLALGDDPAGRPLYRNLEQKGDAIYAEMSTSRLPGGRLTYLWGKATPLYDAGGTVVGAIETIRDITEFRQTQEAMFSTEQALRAKSDHLEEVNVALKVLLDKRGEEQTELKDRIVSNIRALVVPYIERLGASHLGAEQQTLVEILQANLADIAAPLASTLSSGYYNLTPMEIRVANLVKEGLSINEMEGVLCLSRHTIVRHRYNIRIKLGLNKTKTNLRTFLMSLK